MVILTPKQIPYFHSRSQPMKSGFMNFFNKFEPKQIPWLFPTYEGWIYDLISTILAFYHEPFEPKQIPYFHIFDHCSHRVNDGFIDFA